MTSPWLRLVGKDSELCEMRHNVRYTLFAHEETMKRVKAEAEAYTIGLNVASCCGAAAIGLFNVGNVQDLLRKMWTEGGKSAWDSMSPRSKIYMTGAGVLCSSVYFGARALTDSKSKLLVQHEAAVTKWRKLDSALMELAYKPQKFVGFSENAFWNELYDLKKQKAELDDPNNVVRTVNRDFQVARVFLNETWEVQDWEKWRVVYGSAAAR